jgi:hypothetical protein
MKGLKIGAIILACVLLLSVMGCTATTTKTITAGATAYITTATVSGGIQTILVPTLVVQTVTAPAPPPITEVRTLPPTTVVTTATATVTSTTTLPPITTTLPPVTVTTTAPPTTPAPTPQNSIVFTTLAYMPATPQPLVIAVSYSNNANVTFQNVVFKMVFSTTIPIGAPLITNATLTNLGMTWTVSPNLGSGIYVLTFTSNLLTIAPGTGGFITTLAITGGNLTGAYILPSVSIG